MFQQRLKQDRQKILKEINRGEFETLKSLKQDYPDFHWTKLTCEKTGDTLLHIACKIGALNAVRYLLESFKIIVIEPRNYIGKTPLHDAAHNSHYEVTKYLLSLNVEVDALKRADWTPLMLACTKTTTEAKETIRLLVENGANVNFQNKDGWTTLHLVSREGNLEILELLMNFNLDLNIITKNGRSALHIACLHGNFEIVDKLIKNSKIDVNLKDGCGNSPIHDAILSGNFEIISYLIENKADINTTNSTGLGILHLAAYKCPDEVVEYVIVKLKVNLDLKSVLGLTPAHFAAKAQRKTTFDILKKFGANIDIEDLFGRKPVDYFELL